MEIISWQDGYNLGIEGIDDQHKKMIGIINRLADLANKNDFENQKTIEELIDEAMDYAKYHFDTEEDYFSIYNYDKAESHIAIHNQYREKIAELQKRYLKTRDKAVFFELTEFLQNWWIWHIQNTDREYVPFLKSKGL